MQMSPTTHNTYANVSDNTQQLQLSIICALLLYIIVYMYTCIYIYIYVYRSDDSYPRVLTITLTDGHAKYTGVEVSRLPDFSPNMAPGGKVLYSGGRVLHGKLLLYTDNIR